MDASWFSSASAFAVYLCCSLLNFNFNLCRLFLLHTNVVMRLKIFARGRVFATMNWLWLNWPEVVAKLLICFDTYSFRCIVQNNINNDSSDDMHRIKVEKTFTFLFIEFALPFREKFLWYKCIEVYYFSAITSFHYENGAPQAGGLKYGSISLCKIAL